MHGASDKHLLGWIALSAAAHALVLVAGPGVEPAPLAAPSTGAIRVLVARAEPAGAREPPAAPAAPVTAEPAESPRSIRAPPPPSASSPSSAPPRATQAAAQSRPEAPRARPARDGGRRSPPIPRPRTPRLTELAREDAPETPAPEGVPVGGPARPPVVSAAAGAGRSAAAPVPDAGADRRVLLALLHREIDRHKRYPRLARRRGRQGTTTVTFELRPDGDVAGPAVAVSSGFSALDRAALRAVEEVRPFAPARDHLSEAVRIRVSVEFRLQ